MIVENLLDTFLNVVAFAFIALLIWLYFKPLGPNDDQNLES